MANTLRIALIADIHHGVDQGAKLGSAALTLMQPFVDWVNAIRPDLVVELGDRINDLDKDADLKWTRDVAHAFTAVQRPCVHILGNHDAYQLPRAESEEVMQTTFASHSRDVHGYHLV
jgi:3',5'-cyclic-AMP phosphodiesterase